MGLKVTGLVRSPEGGDHPGGSSRTGLWSTQTSRDSRWGGAGKREWDVGDYEGCVVSKVCQSGYSEQNRSLCHHLLHPPLGLSREVYFGSWGCFWRSWSWSADSVGDNHILTDTHIRRLIPTVKRATVRSESFWKALTCLEGFAYYQKQFRDKANSFWWTILSKVYINGHAQGNCPFLRKSYH